MTADAWALMAAAVAAAPAFCSLSFFGGGAWPGGVLCRHSKPGPDLTSGLRQPAALHTGLSYVGPVTGWLCLDAASLHLKPACQSLAACQVRCTGMCVCGTGINAAGTWAWESATLWQHLLALWKQAEVVVLPGVQDSWREEGLGVGAEAELRDGVAHAVQQGAVQRTCTAILW